MFDRIAGVYDLINSVMTMGLHHAWRERAADRAELEPGDAALDLCCGTGDLALALRERVGPDGRVVGADFSEQMLELAREKARERGARDVTFEWADALELPYSDASFDAVTVGFGVRNLADLAGGLPRDAPGAQARRQVRDPRDHATAKAAALDLLRPVVRPDRARSSGGLPATRRPTRTCPSRCGASRHPRALRGSWTRPGSKASATRFSPGGSSPSTRPRDRPDAGDPP